MLASAVAGLPRMRWNRPGALRTRPRLRARYRGTGKANPMPVILTFCHGARAIPFRQGDEPRVWEKAVEHGYCRWLRAPQNLMGPKAAPYLARNGQRHPRSADASL